MGRSITRWIVWLVAAIAAAVVLSQLWFAVHIYWWRDHPVGETSFMAWRMDELHAKNPKAQLKYTWVPYERISGNLKRAMVAAEDAKFVDHEGFDWEGIELAMEKNQKKGRVVAGGSTITQQLAKNLFLSPSRSYWRKAQETVITVMLEAMPRASVGPCRTPFPCNLRSARSRAGRPPVKSVPDRCNFGASAMQLSAEQGARLAAMAPNPRFYERNQAAPGLNRKIGIILARMPGADIP